MINIELLKRLNKTRIINLRALCKLADLNYFSIYTKMDRETELKVNEAEQIKIALLKQGLKLVEPLEVTE